MIAPHVTAWLALNCLVLAASTIRVPKDGYSVLGSNFVIATFSCSLLASGQLQYFMKMELMLWVIQIVTLTLFISIYESRRGKGDPQSENLISSANKASFASSTRMTLAFGTWLWAGGSFADLLG